MKFIGNIDLNKNELQNARIQNLATAPASPFEGQVYYNTVDKKYYGWNGTVWKDLTSEGLKISGADTTEGFLENKLLAGTNITITKENTGANEDLKIAVGTKVVIDDGTQTLTNKTINADNNTIQNLTVNNLKAGVLDTDLSSVSTNDDTLASAKAIKAYIDQLLGANDAMVYKGVIDCSLNPNYPAGNKGETYRVSVAGKIGGASGINVEVGDMIICLADSSTAGTQATVGANWNIVQTNIDGAVVGGASATDNAIARFDGTTGKVVQNSLATIDDSGSINIPSGQSYKINGVNIIAQKTGKYATNFGDGTSSQYTITHNLNTTDININIWDNGTKELVGADIQYIDVNSIKIITGLPIPTSNQYRVVVIG